MGRLGSHGPSGQGVIPHFAAEGHCGISARFVDGQSTVRPASGPSSPPAFLAAPLAASAGGMGVLGLFLIARGSSDVLEAVAGSRPPTACRPTPPQERPHGRPGCLRVDLFWPVRTIRVRLARQRKIFGKDLLWTANLFPAALRMPF
jgi:hypothetical protein